MIIQPGHTYTILDTRDEAMKQYVGARIQIEEILQGAYQNYLYVCGHIEGHRGKFVLWARFGLPRSALCTCPYLTFPHRRTSKCHDPEM